MKKSITVIIIITIVTILIILNLQTQKLVACTTEAKICPDASTVGRIDSDCEFSNCPTTNEIYCEQEQRNIKACIEIYQPVCGWDNPEKINCFTFPCATTYSNSCFACQNPNVEYYTQGECQTTN
jgi:hypothetical protein